MPRPSILVPNVHPYARTMLSLVPVSCFAVVVPAVAYGDPSWYAVAALASCGTLSFFAMRFASQNVGQGSASTVDFGNQQAHLKLSDHTQADPRQPAALRIAGSESDTKI
jgi:hypothetical protein